MAKLGRKFKDTSNLQNSQSFQAFDVYLRDYHSPAISFLCTHTYSKLEAIRLLATHTLDHGEALNIVRALLTDQGLLFPQTRERYYTQPRHSLYRYEQCSGMYRRGLREMGVDENTDLPTRVRIFARQVYNNRFSSISFDRVSQAIEKMLKDCKAGWFPQIAVCEDVGYCKAELGNLEQGVASSNMRADPSAAERIMDTWLQTVYLTFDGQITVSGHDYLKKKLNFTVSESYEFLTEILGPCLNKERQYQICRAHLEPYTPVLYTSQEPGWQQQLERFRSEDLSPWKDALPALEQYLHLNTTRFGNGAHLSDLSDSDNFEYVNNLVEAFTAYLSRTEPKNSQVDLEALAACFVNSTYGPNDAVPLFMDLPSVIFYLFRSPVFRRIDQLEDHNWKLDKTVEYACIRFPLPITCQSLSTDKKLYFAIVDVCEAYCRVKNITFDVSPWRALWKCIQQSVQCLAFQKEDLFTVRYSLRELLPFHAKGYPLLDQVLSDKLESENSSAYISLFRTLVNRKFLGTDSSSKQNAAAENAQRHIRRLKGVRDQRLKELRDTVSQYRSLFEQPRTELDEISESVQSLCAEIGFNRITFLPDRTEWRELANEWFVSPRARKGPIPTIQNTHENCRKPGTDMRSGGPRTIDMILTEWLLLQWSCMQARWELMFVTETLLKSG